LDTEQIQHHDHKNTARILHLWYYFIQDPKALEIIIDLPIGFPINNIISLLFHPRSKGAAGKKIACNLFFTQICFKFSCGFAGTIQVLRLKILKTQCD